MHGCSWAAAAVAAGAATGQSRAGGSSKGWSRGRLAGGNTWSACRAGSQHPPMSCSPSSAAPVLPGASAGVSPSPRPPTQAATTDSAPPCQACAAPGPSPQPTMQRHLANSSHRHCQQPPGSPPLDAPTDPDTHPRAAPSSPSMPPTAMELLTNTTPPAPHLRVAAVVAAAPRGPLSKAMLILGRQKGVMSDQTCTKAQPPHKKRQSVKALQQFGGSSLAPVRPNRSAAAPSPRLACRPWDARSGEAKAPCAQEMGSPRAGPGVTPLPTGPNENRSMWVDRGVPEYNLGGLCGV